MGLWPTLQLQVAPGYSPTQDVPSGAWVDVVDHLRSANPKRGRQRQLDDFTTGTMPLVLSSLDGLLDPLDPAGPYYGLLQPGMPARLQAVWSGTTYPLWFGFADAFELDWPGNRDAAVNLPCSDVFGQLAVKKINHADYGAIILADTPWVYYRLGDPIGSTTAADLSGNARDGTYGGTPVLGVQGAFLTEVDTAVDFGGRDGWVAAPTAAGISGASAWTIEAWVRPDGLGGSGSPAIWFEENSGLDGSGNRLSFVEAQLWNVNSTLNAAQLSTFDGTNEYQLIANFPVDDADGWHHLVWTRGTDGKTTKFYFDGALNTSGVAPVVINVPAPVEVTVGGSQGAGAMDGNLDEFVIYPVALSATQIAAHYNAGFVPWDGQTTGQRIQSVLDVDHIPTSRRNIDTGTALLAGLTESLVDKFSLPYLQNIAKAELGRLFVASDGRLTFHDADRDAAHATSLGTFTDADPTTGILAPGALPYQPGGIKPRLDLVEVSSEVQVTRSGGVTQIARDPRQPPPYGNRSLELSDLPLRDDGQAANLAATLLAARKDPKWRIDKLVLDPRASDSLWPHVLGREIGDLITVVRRPPTGGTITMSCRIEGVEHKIDANKRTWITTWTLATNLFVSTVATSGWDAGEWDTPSFHWV